jgi:hypothetical protein
MSVLAGHLAPVEESPALQRTPCAAVRHYASEAGAQPYASPPQVQETPHPDDIVIVCAVRTPICKAKKGGLKDTPAEDLLSTVLASVVERTKIDPACLGDVVVGSVLGSNVWRANQARIAMFLAGYPDTARSHRRARRGRGAHRPPGARAHAEPAV